MTFAPIDGAVCIVQPGQRPVRLSSYSVEDLIIVFERENATDLHAALKAAWDELQRSNT